MSVEPEVFDTTTIDSVHAQLVQERFIHLTNASTKDVKKYISSYLQRGYYEVHARQSAYNVFGKQLDDYVSSQYGAKQITLIKPSQ